MKAVGHAWKVLLRTRIPLPAQIRRETQNLPKRSHRWIGGTLYNYGLEPPHYPVPAIIYSVTYRKRYEYQITEIDCLDIEPLTT